MSEEALNRLARLGLSAFAAFLGFAVAFGLTLVVAIMTNYALTPQKVWFFTAAPLFTVGAFVLVWRVTR